MKKNLCESKQPIPWKFTLQKKLIFIPYKTYPGSIDFYGPKIFCIYFDSPSFFLT